MKPHIVLMAGSLGGLQAVSKILADLPKDFPAPLVVVLHRKAARRSYLVDILRRATLLPVEEIAGPQELHPGTVYVAPANQHAVVKTGGGVALMDGRRIRHVLSSANPLFETAAAEFGPRVIAVVLSGTDSDAAEGARAVKDAGGTVLAQDRATSASFGMPAAAIATGAVDRVLPLEKIAPALVALAATPLQEAGR